MQNRLYHPQRVCVCVCVRTSVRVWKIKQLILMSQILCVIVVCVICEDRGVCTGCNIPAVLVQSV